MQNWVTEMMEQFGYLGVFLMMALENLFPPIPSEVVLPFGGFLTSHTNLTVIGVIIAATLGSVIGSMVLYCFGMVMDVSRLEKLISRYGHILRVRNEDVHGAAAWFDKYGYLTVFFCRMVPLIRSLISVPAGMSNMNITAFLLLTTSGTLVWNTLLISAGAALGSNWTNILGFMKGYASIVYAFFLLFAFAVIILYFGVNKRRK